MKFSILLKSGELLTPDNSNCFLRSDGKVLLVFALDGGDDDSPTVFQEGEFIVEEVK